MDDSPNAAAAVPTSPRPSFTSFWKRTKEVASAATKQVTFVPSAVPGVSKTRNDRKKKKKESRKDNKDKASDDAANTGVEDGVNDEECGGSDGNGPGEGDGEGEGEGDESTGTPGSALKTAQEKARIRRAQVRRAQIQHRQRKVEYMRQLEIDVETLRGLIDTVETEVRSIRKENDSIRARLGHAPVVGDGVRDGGVGIVGGGGPVVTGVGETGGFANPAMDVDGTDWQNDTSAFKYPDLLAPPQAPAAPGFATTSGVPAPPPLSSHASSASTPAATATAAPAFALTPGSGVAPTPNTTENNPDGPVSLFGDIDLDDITVSIVMDETIGNPVYRISGRDDAGSLSVPSPDFSSQVVGQPGFSVPSASPYSPSPTSMTATSSTGPTPTWDASPVALGQVDSALPALPAMVLPRLTVAQTHLVVNFILALEHVCWGHAGHQYHPPNSEMSAESGHSLMASSLFLRDAPESVYTTIEANAKGPCAFMLNQGEHSHEEMLRTHRDALDQSWQAPDITLQMLYGLAVSLRPFSDCELAPVQAWFELAARFPLSVLLRSDVLDQLKRELFGVVRCMYFGPTMERGAFESVVRRVVEPVVAAEAAAMGLAGPATQMEAFPVAGPSTDVALQSPALGDVFGEGIS
ncbi:Basic-leucine zipper (bZIP) transcription factor [Niveomyces insectorum RCEF 264]|uniref:Putative transcription factor kapC n=1 Tax=Niveomyces insectorum RCEF 264 TaxID=1081102 RepID=A0A167VGW6_9HYPO|nr:Basic-leucine zipper (bZIP) transcription factor [Niveomyces insectorum RCEF 264]